jgi:hypothetical protein
MRVWVIGAALLALLSGCESAGNSRFLRTETADDTYRRIDFPFTTNLSGTYTVSSYYTLFEHQGRTAICGYVVNRMTGCDGNLTDEWFKQARFTLDGKPIGTGSYALISRPNAEGKYQARCVETDVPWDEKYQRGVSWLRAFGQSVMIRC